MKTRKEWITVFKTVLERGTTPSEWIEISLRGKELWRGTSFTDVVGVAMGSLWNLNPGPAGDAARENIRWALETLEEPPALSCNEPPAEV